MTAPQLPGDEMALPGHADDCAACGFDALPAEDKEVLDASAFRLHSREEPPPAPSLPLRGLGVAGLGLVVLLCIRGPVLATLAMLIVAAGLVWFYIDKAQHALDESEWQVAHEAWKAVQTEVWLEWRAMARVWPCPTCGVLSCSNQHSVTETVTYRSGGTLRSESRTDPRLR